MGQPLVARSETEMCFYCVFLGTVAIVFLFLFVFTACAYCFFFGGGDLLNNK